MKVATETQYSLFLLDRIGETDLRLGQAFVNTFFRDGMTDPVLFYCSTNDFYDLVIKYVDWGNFNFSVDS